jgi:DNA replication protein DnaC
MSPDINDFFDRVYERTVSKAHKDVNFEGVAPSAQQAVSEICDIFMNPPYFPERSLLILGGVGCGKTSIMAIILRRYLRSRGHYIADRIDLSGGEVIDNGAQFRIQQNGVDYYGNTLREAPFWWGTHAQLIKELRDHYYNGQNLEIRPSIIPESMKRPGLVFFIDDYGTAFMDQAGVNQMLEYEFFNMAWEHKLMVVMTSNLNETELDATRKGKGELTQMRTTDRIMDNKWMARLTIGWGSRR